MKNEMNMETAKYQRWMYKLAEGIAREVYKENSHEYTVCSEYIIAQVWERRGVLCPYFLARAAARVAYDKRWAVDNRPGRFDKQARSKRRKPLVDGLKG